jgi:hypothetical protein
LAESSFRRAAIGKTRIWCQYQSNSQNLFKFYCHFLGRRARGVFSVPLAFRKSFEVLPIALAEKRGSLEGVRERGFIALSAKAFLNCDSRSYTTHKAGPGMNSPNSVTARGKPKRRRARPFFETFGAAPPRDVTLLHIQPVAALWGAPRRALGVRYCPGGVLIRSSECLLR